MNRDDGSSVRPFDAFGNGDAADELVHDELAALFLSPPAPSKPPPQPAPKPAVHAAHPPAPSRTTGNAPLRLRHPDVATHSPENGAAKNRAHAIGPEAATDRPRTIEAVVLGHLPVRASLWLRQYAAAAGFPVGLVRLSGGSVRIELIGDDGGPGGPIGSVGGIDAALEALRTRAAHVIFAADEMQQIELVTDIAADRVTVLSTTNDAAVVHAYKLIKAIAASAADFTPPEVAIAMAGDTEERASAAADRIRTACERFMGLEAAIGPTVTRVEYARSQTLYVGTDDRDPAAFANAIRGIPHRSPRKTTTGTPRTPATEEPPTGFGSRIQAERPASSDHATALLGWIHGVTQIDLPCPVATNVIFAIDDAGHGHAVSDGAHLAELHRAAAWWNQNRRLIAALHPAVETTSCIHLHVVTRDHPVAVALAAGGYRCHWITRGTAATDSRLIAVEITPADS